MAWTDVCTPFSTLKCVEKYFAHIPPSLHHLPLSFKLAVPIPFLYVFLHISCSWPVRLVHSWAALGVAKLSTNGQPPLTTFCNECKRPIIEVAELWSLIVAVFDLLVNEKNIRWWRRVNHFEIDTYHKCWHIQRGGVSFYARHIANIWTHQRPGCPPQTCVIMCIRVYCVYRDLVWMFFWVARYVSLWHCARCFPVVSQLWFTQAIRISINALPWNLQ